MRWLRENPPVSMSALANPIRTSLTSGEGVVRVPPCMRSPFVDVWGDVACGCGLGRVPNRGSAMGFVLVECVVSPWGICHEPSPAKVSMSSTVMDGTGRSE